MEVLAITNNLGTVKGRNVANSMYFGESNIPIDEVAYRYAVDKTISQAKKRNNNIIHLLCSVPLLGGISAAILHKGNSKVLNKEITGLAGKLSEGIKKGGDWVGLLGLGVAIGAVNGAIEKNSDSYKNFRDNHRFLSFGIDAGVFLTALATIPMGIKKLASKIKPNHIEKMSRGIQNIAEHVNRIKTPQFIKDFGTKISDKVPNAIKNISVPDFVKAAGKFAKGIGCILLEWAPSLALFAAIFESVSNRAKTEADLVRNFNEAKKELEEV